MQVHGFSLEDALQAYSVGLGLPPGRVLRRVASATLRGRVWITDENLAPEVAFLLWSNIVNEAPVTGLWPVVGVCEHDAHNFGWLVAEWAWSADEEVVRRFATIRNHDNELPAVERLGVAGFESFSLPTNFERFASLVGSSQLCVVFGSSASAMSSEVRHYGIDGVVLGSWLQRFDGVVLQAGFYVMVLIMRCRPASLIEAELLVNEAKCARVRITNAEEDDFTSQDFLTESIWLVWWNGSFPQY
jgi:hypothetical protein